MLRRTSLALTSIIALTTALSGCLVVVDTPIGSDATVEASWTIEGATPTTASCAAIGIDTVRIGFYDSVDPFYDTTLQAPCANGSFVSAGPVLAAGTYRVRVEGWRGNTLVGSGNMQTITATLGGRVIIGNTDFVSGGFDPLGDDASVEGSWTVEGAVPSAASCSTLGVDTVRLAFYNGATPFYDTSLEAPCAQGGLDTRPTRVLAAGSYTVRFEAFRAGTLVGQGAMQSIDVSAGGHIVIAPADFTSGGFDPMGSDATLTAGWTLNGSPATANNCFAIGATDVRVVLFASTDTEFTDGIEVARATCGAGRIDTRPMPVIRAGSYLVSVEMWGGDAFLASFEPNGTTPVAITAGSHVDIPAPDFIFPTTLTIGLDWLTAAGGVGTCATAGVAQLSYTLTNGTGLSLDSGGRVPCGSLLTFNSMDDGIGGGTYNLYFEGYDASGAKHWAIMGAMCRNVVVANNGLVSTQCVADYIP